MFVSGKKGTGKGSLLNFLLLGSEVLETTHFLGASFFMRVVLNATSLPTPNSYNTRVNWMSAAPYTGA